MKFMKYHYVEHTWFYWIQNSIKQTSFRHKKNPFVTLSDKSEIGIIRNLSMVLPSKESDYVLTIQNKTKERWAVSDTLSCLLLITPNFGPLSYGDRAILNQLEQLSLEMEHLQLVWNVVSYFLCY